MIEIVVLREMSETEEPGLIDLIRFLCLLAMTYVDNIGSLALLTRVDVEILACTVINSLIKLH